MVEVKEPFIAEHAASQRVPPRRPRRTAGGGCVCVCAPSSLLSFALLKRQPCRVKLCPIPPKAGSVPVSSSLGVGVGGGDEGPHTVPGSPRTAAPLGSCSLRGWDGTEDTELIFAEKCC